MAHRTRCPSFSLSPLTTHSHPQTLIADLIRDLLRSRNPLPSSLRVIANKVSDTLWASHPRRFAPDCRFASLRGNEAIQMNRDPILWHSRTRCPLLSLPFLTTHSRPRPLLNCLKLIPAFLVVVLHVTTHAIVRHVVFGSRVEATEIVLVIVAQGRCCVFGRS